MYIIQRRIESRRRWCTLIFTEYNFLIKFLYIEIGRYRLIVYCNLQAATVLDQSNHGLAVAWYFFRIIKYGL